MFLLAFTVVSLLFHPFFFQLLLYYLKQKFNPKIIFSCQSLIRIYINFCCSKGSLLTLFYFLIKVTL